jgi:hypothetical protein
MPTASVSCCLAIGTPLRGRPQRAGQLEPRKKTLRRVRH